MFLVRKKKAVTAHTWTGYDTVCRLYSTGGMNKKRYEVVSKSDLPLCTMCGNKAKIYPKDAGPQADFPK
jgi:thiamine biosynthesis protein ThiC